MQEETPKISSAWEELVKKQLKTEDIYSVLSKENLEGISVLPYYSHTTTGNFTLPKIEESTQLVSRFYKDADENTYAFLITENVENLEGKSLFVADADLAKHILVEDGNTYFSLVDVFDEKNAKIDGLLAKSLLEKNFKRKICIDISLHQNAGASISQQIAFALAKSWELAEIFGGEILSNLVLRTAIGGNYFFGIAKIRALKIVFNQLSREFGRDDIPYIFAETTLRNKSVNDKENNLIRSALELSAAMIGGADAVFSNDFKIENHTALSEEISFKQQIVLAYESIVNVFDDAASGSFYVEDVTRQFAENSWKLFLEIEEKGGYLQALKSGFIQDKIREHAVLEQKWAEDGKIALVGVNLYPKLQPKKSAEELYPKGEIKAVRLAEMFE